MTPVAPIGAVASEWQLAGVNGTEALPAPTAVDAAGAGANVLGVDGVDGVASTGSAGFGSVLADQIGKLSNLQESAAVASQSLANGTATDIASVVTAVEKAQLAMQLAGQIRTKGSEAINDIFHTQI